MNSIQFQFVQHTNFVSTFTHDTRTTTTTRPTTNISQRSFRVHINKYIFFESLQTIFNSPRLSHHAQQRQSASHCHCLFSEPTVTVAPILLRSIYTHHFLVDRLMFEERFFIVGWTGHLSECLFDLENFSCHCRISKNVFFC